MQSGANGDDDANDGPDAYVFSPATRALIDASQNLPEAASLESNLKRVSRRIEELYCEIRALKSCRNAATITCRLPNELLLSIFFLLSESESDVWKRYSYAWIRVTHVCRHWRATALNCPALWAQLNYTGTSPMLMELLLERSGRAELTVTHRNCEGNLANLNALVKGLSHMDRIRSLTLFEVPLFWGPSADTSLRELLDLSTGSPQALKLLELAFSSSTDFSTTPDFFRRKMPNISRVRLLDCSIPWGTVPYGSHMTSLALLHTFPPLNRPSATEFFAKLAKMPLLESLDLSHFLPRHAEDTPRDPPFVFLSLRWLSLCDTQDRLIAFLRSAHSHVVSCINLDVALDTAIGFLPQLIVEALSFSRPRESTGKPHLRHLSASQNSISMGAHWAIQNLPPGSLSNTSRRLELNITGMPIDPQPALLTAISEHFNLEDLSHLKANSSMSGARVWDLESYRFFSRLPNLDEIFLATTSIKELLDVLQEEGEEAADTEQGHISRRQMPFPRLSKLELNRMVFRHAVPGESLQDFLDSFIAIATRRSRASFPISELRIVHSSQFDESDITRLRSFCPDVDVVYIGVGSFA